MAQAKAKHLHIAKGQTPDKVSVNINLHSLDENERQIFYWFYRELADLYEILSPDPLLCPFIDDYNRVSRMYRLLCPTYDSVFVDEELTRKDSQACPGPYPRRGDPGHARYPRDQRKST